VQTKTGIFWRVAKIRRQNSDFPGTFGHNRASFWPDEILTGQREPPGTGRAAKLRNLADLGRLNAKIVVFKQKMQNSNKNM